MPFPELKYVNASVLISDAAATVSNVGNVFFFGGVVQGEESDERIGKEITLNKLKIRGFTLCNTNGVNQAVRIVVIQYFGDTQNGTIPQWNDIFTRASGNLDSIQSFYGRDVQGNFKVLHDHIYINVDGASNKQNEVRLELPLNRQKITFVANNDNPQNGCVAMYAITENAATANSLPLFYFRSRLTYYDN